MADETEIAERPSLIGLRLDAAEKADMLEWYDSHRDGSATKGIKWNHHQAIRGIAIEFSRSERTVAMFIDSMRDTTKLARRTLAARSIELVERMIDKADPELIADILSRPNLAVLEPIKKGNDAPQVLISVNQGSLGAIAEPIHTDALYNKDTEVLSHTVEGEVIHAIGTGSALPDDATGGPVGVQGQLSRGGQEHEDRGDPYPGGVRGDAAGQGKSDGGSDEGASLDAHGGVDDAQADPSPAERPRITSAARRAAERIARAREKAAQEQADGTYVRVRDPNSKSKIHLRYDA